MQTIIFIILACITGLLDFLILLYIANHCCKPVQMTGKD